MVDWSNLGYPSRTFRREREDVVDVWIIAGIIAVVGAGIAAVFATRRPQPTAMPAIVEVHDVVVLKERVQLHLELEEDLIAAGQALGRVRRFLVDPEDATPVVDELRDRLTDLWLRRFDYEGRLRLAALRRRIPPPPAIEKFTDTLSAEGVEERSVEILELANRFRDIARRAEDSARMFRRLAPGEDAHARWVGDAVEVAREWRQAQTEEIQRFAARLAAQGDRLEELSAQMGEALAESLLADPGQQDRTEVTVEIPGLAERIRGVARVGLAEAKERDIVPGTAAELDAEQAIDRARQTISDVRALARRAGGTRSARAAEFPGTAEFEPETAPE